ncbi:MAG TPA: hypothetical protein PK683_13015, partial [Leptospiraceae bacterium]|nr:hypothetical protein [Leptospiraceae bacterium]
MKIKIDLLPGEEMLFELEADFWSRGNNPITKIVGNFFRIIAKIMGMRVRGFLTVTNKRIIETREDVICYCITSGRHTKVVTKESVKEVGYEMTKMCGLCCDS